MTKLSYTNPLPEDQIIASKHVLYVEYTASVLNDPQAVRRYAGKALKQAIGDEVQLGAIKVKKPGIIRKGVGKVLRRTPRARLYVTTVF